MPPKKSTRQNSVANSHVEVESQGHSHAMGEIHAQGGGQTLEGENPLAGGQALGGRQVLGGREIPVGGPQQMTLMFEMIKGMQQNQVELAESLRQLREANGNKEDHQNKNDNRNHEGKGKRSAMEHISKFLDSMGPLAAYGDLCLREFSKSLVDRAYTWYTVLPTGSIRTWEDMVESFCSKYFHVEEKITLVNLHSTKQQTGEDLVKYIHRFRDVSLDCHVKYQEGELVEVCIDNMLPEFRAHLENLDISRSTTDSHCVHRNPPSGTKRKNPTEKAYEEPPPLPFTAEEMMAIFDKWVQDQVIKLPKISKQPTAEEQKDPKYCRYHRYVNHPTVDCRTLRWEAEESAAASSSLVPAAVRTLQKSPKFKSLFNQLGFGPKARNAATEALITIAAESGATCFTAEAHASRAFLETTNAITFTDEDMEVQYPDHRRPLYLSAVVKDVQVRRALVDTGSCLNLIPLSTLQAANVPQQKIQGSPMEVGPIVALTRFHVVNAETPYHVLLGRPWLHKHKLVSSTYHQCVKGRLNGKPIRIAANSCPFDQTEAHFVEAALYDDLASTGEPSIQEGPTPEEGGLQPSCHLIQQTENSGKVVVDQLQSTAMSSEEVTVDHAQSTVMNPQEVAVDQTESMAINSERPAVDQTESMAMNSKEVAEDQTESTAMSPGRSTVDHARSTVMNSEEEAMVDQTESTTMRKEKSTAAESNMTSKEELEVINLSNDPDISKPISISKSLSAKERKCLIDLLHEYKDVFAWDYHEMPGIDPGLVAHSLNVEPGTRPVVQPMRTFHTEVEAQITQEVKEVTCCWIYQANYSIHGGCQIFVPVKKKNGQIRCCVDFRNLNKACPKDEFPLPNMDLLIDSAAGHAMFSFMDGFSGYNQIRMSTKDAEKTAFRTPIGNFYYTVMPFGLKNAGATYQRTMTAMFHDMMHKEIEDYVDDIVVKSKKREDHLGILRKAKASAIATMKAPTSHKELKSFLGRLSYIRRFIPGLAAVTAVFTPLMKKGVSFVWSTACQQAFEKDPTIKSQAIADLLAQFPGEDSSSISHEVPGGMGEALEDGETIAKSFKLDFSCSNNASEYEAYITGLAIAHEMGIKHLRVIGDSNLIICQTKGAKTGTPMLLQPWVPKFSFEGSKVDVTIDKRSMPITDLLREKFKEQNLDAEDWRTPIKAKLMSPEGVADLKVLKDYVLIAGDLYRRLPGGVLARCVNLQEAAKKLIEVHEKCCEFRDGVSLYRRLQRLGYFWPSMSKEAASLQEQCSFCQHQHESDQIYATFISSDWRTPFLEYLIENILPQTSQAAIRLKKLATRYFVEGGILFRKGFHGEPLRCLSLAESQTVMKEAHSGECGEHQGKKRLYQLLLTLGYYWPTMKKDTADFVKSCHTCQLQANLIHTHPTSLQNMATPWPFHTWGLDLIGPINPSSGGYIWILVATEYFSKWVEAIPLRKATGAAVANFIREHIITRLEFSSGRHIMGLPWINQNSNRLHLHFSLVYGTDAISPTELLVPSPRILHGMDLEADADICAEARVADLEGLEEARELAQGQMVLRMVDHVRRGLPSPFKFAPNWEGPYLIREAYDSGYYKLSTADGTTLVDPINGKWLKRYYS
uniref:Uncharacterized protein n=1 Tax=Fagus sylvatica TaxID=28930 RepID=A0A2N9H521_FAGSY